MPMIWPIKGTFPGTSGGSLGSMPLRLKLQSSKATAVITKYIMVVAMLVPCTTTSVAVAFEVIVVRSQARASITRSMMSSVIAMYELVSLKISVQAEGRGGRYL
jgi:hypothetical protein